MMPKDIQIALEGGAGKACAFPGGLQALEDLGFRITGIAGTSAGAITGSMLAAGCTAAELVAMVDPRSATKAPWKTFVDLGWAPKVAVATGVLSAVCGTGFFGANQYGLVDTSTWLPTGLVPSTAHALAVALGMTTTGLIAGCVTILKRFHMQGGLFLGDKLKEWVRLRLREKLGLDRDAVFEDMKIPLHVIASAPQNPETKIIIFNKENVPSFPVHEAVRASASLPLFFVSPTVGFSYPGKRTYESRLVDGGCLSNLPLEALGPPWDNVFGLLLDEGLPQKSLLHWLAPGLSLLRDTMEMSRTYHDSSVIAKHADRIIRLPVMGYSTYKFQPSVEEYERISKAAYQAVALHEGLNQFKNS